MKTIFEKFVKKMKKGARSFRDKKERTSNFVKRCFSALIKVIIGIVIGVVLGLFFIPQYIASQQIQAEPVVTSELIYTRIEQVSELISTKYYYTDAVAFKENNQINGWNIPLTQKSFVVTYDGIISAGIDLQEIKIDIEDKLIRISLPEAKIIAHEVNDTRVLDERDGLFNRVTIEDQDNVMNGQKTAMETRATENGLLTQTKEDAKKVIEKLVLPDDLKEAGYQIQFKE